MSNRPGRPHRGPRYLNVTDAEMELRRHNQAETDQLIEDLGAIARHPETVSNGQREDLIHACAEVIAELTKP